MNNNLYYREKFGDDLKVYWQRGWQYRKDFLQKVNDLYNDYAALASKNDPLVRKPCRLDDGNFSNLIHGQGSPQRDLGYKKYEPEKLLWMVATLMAYSCLSSERELHKFLYSVCPECFVNDDGREWVKKNARHILLKLGYVWPEVTTDIRIASVRIEPAKAKQPLRKTILRPFTEEEAKSNTDELALEKLRQWARDTGPLTAVTSTQAIGIIIEHTQIE